MIMRKTIVLYLAKNSFLFVVLNEHGKGVTPQASSMTPEQIEIRELKKELAHLEEHNEILTKTTALLISDSLNNSR